MNFIRIKAKSFEKNITQQTENNVKIEKIIKAYSSDPKKNKA